MRFASRSRLAGLGLVAGLLALTGSCVAAGRLETRLRNPDGIPISHPDRHPVATPALELFTSRSPGGAFHTVARQTNAPSGIPTLLVVDTTSSLVVGRLPRAQTGGRAVDLGWRDPTTLWASVGPFPGDCDAAYVAGPPTWDFVPDHCDQRPPGAGLTRLGSRAPSPDGVLIATARYDRSGPWHFGDARPPVPDVRIEDRHGRFLAQFGNLDLVGWTMDGALIVVAGPTYRAYSITRAEIDSIVR